MLIDYLSRGAREGHRVRRELCRRPTARTGSTFGEPRCPGPNRTRRSPTRSRRRATSSCWLTRRTTGKVSGVETVPDAGYPLDDARHLRARVDACRHFRRSAGAAAGLGHNLFMLDPDGALRHTVPFVRTGRSRHCRRSALAAALRVAGIKPTDVRLDGTLLQIGDRVDAAVVAARADRGRRRRQLPLGADRISGALRLLDDLKSRTYPTYSFFDLI